MPYFGAACPGRWKDPRFGPYGRSVGMSDEVPKCRVLVVEDEALVGMEIGGSIEWQGHEVVGPIAVLDEALAVLANANLDCAILDINIRGGQSYPVADILLQRGVPVDR